MNRRETLRLLGGATAAAMSPSLLASRRALAQAEPVFKLPPLGYAYEALEPHIDTRTMTIHHQNHHQAYVNNINALVEKVPDLKTKGVVEILSDIGSVPEAVRAGVRKNLGGHWNHTFFWELMTPGGAKAPPGDLKSAIDGVFGSVEQMQQAVSQAAMTRFGSGWAWLVVGKDKKLSAINTPYQDTPHMEAGARPVLGIDVWEHAYYLKHQSRRADYVKAWWSTVNWDKAAANFKAATG